MSRGRRTASVISRALHSMLLRALQSGTSRASQSTISRAFRGESDAETLGARFAPTGRPGYIAGRIGTTLAALAGLAFLVTLRPTPADAQEIVVQIGQEATASVIPGEQITVDVLVDMSDAGGLELADLDLEITWDASLASFVSTTDGDFGSLSVDDADAANGTISASLTSGGTTSSFTLLTLTLEAGSTEELVELQGSVAAAIDGSGSDVSGSVSTRKLNLCIGIAGLFGDVTGDDAVNIVDAQQIARFSVGLSVADPDRAQALGDVTQDGSVNIIDAQQTARFSVGLSTGSSAGEQKPADCEIPTPSISSISSLVEGQSATISGSSFSDVPGENTVLVDGTQATVTAATETELTIDVPVFECRPERTVQVTVEADGLTSDPASETLSPPSFLDVPVGEQQVISAAGSGIVCLQFAASGGSESYVVGVQSTSEVASSVTPVVFDSETGSSGGGGGLVASGATPRRFGSDPVTAVSGRDRRAGAALGSSSGGRELAVAQGVADRWRAHREAEARLRAWEREHLFPRSEIASRFVSSRQAGLRDTGGQVMTAIPSDVSVGDIVTVRVPDRTASNSCDSFIEVTAEVMALGSRGVWLNDTDNPSNGYTTADYEALSDELDSTIYDTEVSYFGEPTDLDGNSRLVVLITKEVNDFTGILGFVWSGDLFPRTSCASSDEGEIFYGIAPDPDGVHAFGPYSLAEAKEDAPFLIAHEFTHTIQLGRRLDQTPFPGHMAVWELEGGATFSEEVVGHDAEGRATGQNLGAAVAWNEDDPSSINWYGNAFTDLAIYFGFGGGSTRIPDAPEECTFLDRPPGDGPCVGSRSVYGTPWSLLRWISDHYGPDFPGGEQAIHRAFIDNDLAGYENLEDVIGESIETILARWAASLYVDDRFSGLDPMLTIPSWDFFEIFESRVDNAKLKPRMRSFTDFSDSYDVRAASSAYTVISGSGRPPVAIRVAGLISDLPSFMQVWIVRAE